MGSKSKSPGTLKETLAHNVHAQQERKEWAASPPEAQRSPRERVKTQEAKRRRQEGR